MFSLPVARIAQLLGAPSDNVATTWPLVESELCKRQMSTTGVAVCALATIRIESPTFLPQTEKWNGDPHEYFNKKYGGRYGDLAPDDGFKFRGRGLIQLTFEQNYLAAGKAIGLDLVQNPDLVLKPEVSAAVLAWFFETRHVAAAANAQNWILCRKLVNGGSGGLTPFLIYVSRLQANSALAPTQLPPPVV